MVFRSTVFSVILAACVLGLVWLSVPTVLSLHQSWVDFNYSHGYLIALIVGGLVYRTQAVVTLYAYAENSTVHDDMGES